MTRHRCRPGRTKDARQAQQWGSSEGHGRGYFRADRPHPTDPATEHPLLAVLQGHRLVHWVPLRILLKTEGHRQGPSLACHLVLNNLDQKRNTCISKRKLKSDCIIVLDVRCGECGFVRHYRNQGYMPGDKKGFRGEGRMAVLSRPACFLRPDFPLRPPGTCGRSREVGRSRSQVHPPHPWCTTLSKELPQLRQHLTMDFTVRPWDSERPVTEWPSVTGLLSHTLSHGSKRRHCL